MALTDKLTAIGDAIRAKTGDTAMLTLDEMPTAIAGITTGVEGEAGCRIIAKTIIPTQKDYVIEIPEIENMNDLIGAFLWNISDSSSGIVSASCYHNIIKNNVEYPIYSYVNYWNNGSLTDTRQFIGISKNLLENPKWNIVSTSSNIIFDVNSEYKLLVFLKS